MECKRCKVILHPIHSRYVESTINNNVFCSDNCKDEYEELERYWKNKTRIITTFETNGENKN